MLQYSYNRIGIIIIEIPKMNNEQEYSDFKEELLNNKEDAMCHMIWYNFHAYV